MNQPSRSPSAEVADRIPSPAPPPRPGFGFLLGGTTLGIFFGCLLLCAGASPPHLIIIVLSICGAITGGVVEWLWPKPVLQSPSEPQRPETTGYDDISVSPFRDEDKSVSPRKQSRNAAPDHECRRCGEVFEPSPITCPMCGHSEKLRGSR